MKYNGSNKPLVCMQTQSTCYKGTTKMTPKGVLWHSTGANNPTLKRYVQPSDTKPAEDTYTKDKWLEVLGKNQYSNDWNHIDRQAGLNAWIGKLADGSITTVQTLPWNYKPWGCGSGAKGSCNNGWMQFEICEDDLTDKSYFDKVYQEACELTAYYCKMYNLNPLGTVSYNGVTVPVILCHYDSYHLGLGSNHGDVLHWFKKYGKTMDNVRQDVAKLMNISVEDGKIDGKYVKGQAVQLTKNFKSTEFDCHGKGCCSETLVDQKLVEYAQKIRDHFGKPVNVSSGYRCLTHNRSIGSGDGSQHVKGGAADIYINGVAPIEIARYAENLGIKGIGLYETEADGYFVHIDVRTSKAFWYGQAQAKRDTFQEKPKVVVTGTPSTGSEADQKKMWDFLLSKLGNEYAVAGIMGNINAESAFRSNNLQNTYEKKLGYTDVTYTQAVDSGEYTNFVRDSAGYGLAQWTYWSRKEKLLKYAQEKKKSVGDFQTQLEYLWQELSVNYKTMTDTLKTSTSVRAASDLILHRFEAPADQSEAVEIKRAEYAQKCYDKFHVKPQETKPTSKFKKGDLVTIAADAVYYNGKDVPDWVVKKAWYVKADPVGDRVVIHESEDGKNQINSPISDKYLTLKKVEQAPVEKVFEPYLVRITASLLNYRQGPGTNYKINGTVKKNQVYTIVAEDGKWGKLKSGAGWISLNYTTKV